MAEGLEDLWVAEYSAAQNAFHVGTLAESMRSNLRMVAERSNNDYLIFGIYATAQEADDACEAMERVQGGQHHG